MPIAAIVVVDLFCETSKAESKGILNESWNNYFLLNLKYPASNLILQFISPQSFWVLYLQYCLNLNFWHGKAQIKPQVAYVRYIPISVITSAPLCFFEQANTVISIIHDQGPIMKLNADCLGAILQYLDVVDLSQAELVCRTWRNTVKQSSLWEKLLNRKVVDMSIV